MTTAAAQEVYQVTIMGKLEEQDCQNVMYFRTELGDNNVEDHLLKAILDCFINNLIPVLSSEFDILGIKAKRVVPTLGPELFVGPGVGQETEGQSAGDGLPSFASCRVRIRSTRGGREGLGRFSIGGIPESATVSSFITTESAFWIAVVAYVACVVAAFIHEGFPVANTWSLGVMSRKIGGAKPPFTADGFASATTLQPINAIGTVRSRLVGHGS